MQCRVSAGFKVFVGIVDVNHQNGTIWTIMMGMHIVVISTDQKGTNNPLVIEINTIGLKSHIINALLT